MNNIIISAICSDRPGIVFELTEIIKKYGANIEESRMTRLGTEFVIIMLISIESKSIKSLILDLESIKELVITIKDTESNAIHNGEHCLIELNGADNEGIVNVLSNYLTKKTMNIQNLNTHISNAPITGTPLFNLRAITTIPSYLTLKEIQSDLNQIANMLSVEILVFQADSIEKEELLS